MTPSPEVLKIRVALCTNFIPPYRIPLLRELARRAAALRVMISTPMEADRFWKPEFGGLDVRVQHNLTFRLHQLHPSGFRETSYVHFPYDTILQLARFRPDVIISDQFGFRTMNALVYRLLFRRRLIIWATISEETEVGRSAIRRLLRRRMVQFANAFITSGHSGSRYLQGFRVSPRKIFAVPQTVEVSGFSGMPLARDTATAYRLLYVGRLIQVKYVAPFTALLSEWCGGHADREVEFWIAGDGPERAAIESLSLPANLNLRFLGNVPYCQMPEVYAQAGVLVLPTLADEWGLVVNEAMAAGLPVLGSVYSSAVQELVEEGRSGWRFRANDREDVLNAMGRFFAATEKDLERMRAAARETAIRITPESVADRMMEAVRFALGLSDEDSSRS